MHEIHSLSNIIHHNLSFHRAVVETKVSVGITLTTWLIWWNVWRCVYFWFEIYHILELVKCKLKEFQQEIPIIYSPLGVSLGVSEGTSLGTSEGRSILSWNMHIGVSKAVHSWKSNKKCPWQTRKTQRTDAMKTLFFIGFFFYGESENSTTVKSKISHSPKIYDLFHCFLQPVAQSLFNFWSTAQSMLLRSSQFRSIMYSVISICIRQASQPIFQYEGNGFNSPLGISLGISEGAGDVVGVCASTTKGKRSTNRLNAFPNLILSWK